MRNSFPPPPVSDLIYEIADLTFCFRNLISVESQHIIPALRLFLKTIKNFPQGKNNFPWDSHGKSEIPKTIISNITIRCIAYQLRLWIGFSYVFKLTYQLYHTSPTKKVQPCKFIWRPFIFWNNFCSSNPKNMCDTSFWSWIIKFSLEKILGTILTSCGTQITPKNKNIAFFKGFPHGTQILKLVNGFCLANIYIFGAQSLVSQLSNDVSHVILAFLHMDLFLNEILSF